MTDKNTPKFEYFYKVDGCQARDAREKDCICWHTEGTGPYPQERHNGQVQLVNWREVRRTQEARK